MESIASGFVSYMGGVWFMGGGVVVKGYKVVLGGAVEVC